MANDETLNLLKRVGLNQYESRTYVALLASGNSTAGDLSELANVPRSRVYDVLTSLEKKGFAMVEVGRPVKYSGVSPEDAINHIKGRHEEEHKKKLSSLEELEDSLREELDALYEKGKIADDPEESVGLIRGKANLYNQIKKLIETSEKSVVKMTDAPGFARLEKHCAEAMKTAKKNGVKTRIIVTANGSFKKSETLHQYAAIRKHDGFSGRFFARDGKEAILVTASNTAQQDTGLWVKSPYLTKYLEQLFDHAWEKGKAVGE
ncbi:MAG: helix-turn-helix domain-containing protein [archaeon]